MKRYIYFLFLLPTLVLAQIAPSSEKPYIRVSTPRIATSSEAVLDDYTKATNIIQYMDGSGRAMQTVAYKASPNAQDMLMGTNTLDQVGRIKRSYLPVQGSLSNGSYQANATALAETFYVDTAPYSEVETYEASPFSRALKTVGAGQAFRIGTSKGNTEHIFTAGAEIRKYFVNEDINGNITSVNGSAAFVDGDLLMQQGIDEDNHSIKIFTDKEGRTIEQWQITPNNTDTLRTAYVYDDIGRLRYVIPPKSYNLASTFDETVTPNTSYFNEGIYAFRYDERGRVVEKHVPGGGWHYTVYNELDQALMSQNPRQRQSNLWEWVRYDGHGRMVMAGTWTSSSNRTTIQNHFLNFLADNQFEERSTASGNLNGYTSRSFPSSVAIAASDVKKVYYFDDYTWVNNSALGFVQYQTAQWSSAKGLATGSLVRKFDTNTFLKSVSYYDDKNRLLQTQTENRFGSINRSDLVLNFAGDLLEERTIYRKPSTADLVIATKYSYDHTGRKTGAVHYLNGKPTPLAQYKHDAIGRVVQKRLMQAGNDFIVESTALPSGQQDIANRFVLLTTGTITAQNGTYLACVAPNMLQEIDFSYNIRGQLRGINLDAFGNVLLANGDVFGMKLDYHEDNRFYNGILSKQTWQSTSPPLGVRGFTYDYDGFTRLQSAAYSGIGAENYSLSGMAYDDNGNISTLQRNGLTGSGTWGQIDNLGYNYPTASNRLSSIQESSLINKGFKAPIGGLGTYTYYSDGSLKSDSNRGITDIEYNYLGLPDKVHFGPTKRIENVYDAEGMKLSQKLVNGAITITTDYMGDLIYRSDSLKTILHNEGRVFFDATQTAHYQFFITDHLGNTRAIIERLNANTALVQENHYGAWGEILEGIGQTGNWNFLFQGKEFVDGVGYDFHARQYDAWRGQFDGIDPVDNYSVSGFAGMMNSPTNYIDPDGKNPIVIGAIIGAASYALQTGFSKGGFKNWSWEGFAISTVTGAVFGGFSAGVGEIAGTIGNAVGKFAFQTGAHAALGGANSYMNGGSFLSGAVSGGVSSVWGGATAGFGTVGQIGGAAIFGGVSSKISGGSFWQGAAIGGITAGLNHVTHSIYERIAQTAQKYIGSKDWAYDVAKDDFEEGTNKCNKFCYDVLKEAGVNPELPNGNTLKRLFGFGSPTTAGQWADPTYEIDGWKVVKNPRRGDIVSFGFQFSNATGHVGIVAGRNLAIYAAHSVVKPAPYAGYWDTKGNPFVFRRYVGH